MNRGQALSGIMSTTISPERMAEYKRTAREREAARRQQLAERENEARAVSQAAARLLKVEFGATRVVLFGSLARGSGFHSGSDIDLAAAGIEPHLFFRAWAALDQLAAGFEVNLIDMRDTSERLRQIIAVEGIEL